MSWTDHQAVRVIKQLRDKYKIKTFVETGTFLGINARLHSDNFKWVFTVDNNIDYLKKAIERFMHKSNIFVYYENSYSFLKRKKFINPLFYLDAHFYDPSLPKGKGKFVVLKELKALKNYGKCVIAIHDFDNNLGHITYDGISLDMKLLKKDLLKVYKFHFYTNTLASCDIMKVKETKDKDMRENLKYAWSKPEKTYRGILYCLPSKLSKKEMKEMGLIEWN